MTVVCVFTMASLFYIFLREEKRSHIRPVGIKVINPEQLPYECSTWKDPCWTKSIQNGTVTFISSGATDQTGRPIKFAYFINTSTAFGVTGLYNYLPFYADTGESAGGDISGGDSMPVDWVYGTKNGLIIHVKSTDECYERAFNPTYGTWNNLQINCP